MFELLACVGVVGFTGAVAWWIRRVGAAARAMTNPSEPIQNRTEYVRRLLKHVERKTIAELTEGQAAVIRGRVRALPNVPLILTSQPDVGAIAINIRHLNSLGEQFTEEWSCRDFELVDETGAIRVEGKSVDVAITVAVVPLRTLYTIVGTRFEGVILPDTEVLVLGMVSIDSEATDYRDGEQQRVLRVTESFPVAVSNDRDLFEPGEKVFTMEDVINNKRG